MARVEVKDVDVDPKHWSSFWVINKNSNKGMRYNNCPIYDTVMK
jgi:hypothetical protein